MQRSKEIATKNKKVVTFISYSIHFIFLQRELKVLYLSIIELLLIIELLNVELLSLYFLNNCVSYLKKAIRFVQSSGPGPIISPPALSPRLPALMFYRLS